MSIEDAIRSLEATNATPFFPEGNPDDPDFDIHAYLEDATEVLDTHIPLPIDPGDGAAEEEVRDYRR